MAWIVRHSDELKHHGVKGQVHGRRRWQNEDGSLTPEGRIHYGVGEGRELSRKAYEEREAGESGNYSTESYRKLRKGKYKDLADTINRESTEKIDEAQEAWNEWVDSGKHFFQRERNREERRVAEEKYTKASEDMVNTIFSISEKYIQEHFTKEQWDDARAFVYDHFQNMPLVDPD